MQTARFFSYSRFIFLLNPIEKKKSQSHRQCLLLPKSLPVFILIQSKSMNLKLLNLIFKGILHSRIRGSLATNCYQRCLWILELSLITIVPFTKNKVIQSVNIYLIMDLVTSRLIRSSLPKFFLCNQFVLQVFSLIIKILYVFFFLNFSTLCMLLIFILFLKAIHNKSNNQLGLKCELCD